MPIVRTFSIKNEFKRVIRSADGIYIAMLPYAQFSYEGLNENPLHPAQATKIIELSFMNIIAAWEEFVQAVFMRYMIGGASESGYTPSLRIGRCQSLAHAYETIAGKDGFDPSVDYLDWSNWQKVILKAKIYFQDAQPFSNLTANQINLLRDSVILRNRIAHSSSKCKKDFSNLAKRYLGLDKAQSLPKGLTVGKLLNSGGVRGFSKESISDNYYQSFSVLFHNLADIIAP